MKRVLRISLWVKKGRKRNTVYLAMKSDAHRVIDLLGITLTSVTARAETNNGTINLVMDTGFRIKNYRELKYTDAVGTTLFINASGTYNSSEVSISVVIRPRLGKSIRRTVADIDILITGEETVIEELWSTARKKLKLLKKRLSKYRVTKSKALIEGIIA